jgi:predicted DNA-binding transcriptional regulator YafY
MTRPRDSDPSTATLSAQLQAANPTPSPSGHVPLAERLAALMQRLANGECLKIDENLAGEFGVNTRTLQRDFSSRLSFLPLEKTEQGHALDPRYLGALKPQDIRDFAALAGVSGLFPALDDAFIRDLFDRRLADTLSIHGPAYEDLQQRQAEFRKLQEAIGERRHLRFAYQNAEGTRKEVEAQPYRLANVSGIWYLFAVDVADGKPKSYAFGRLSHLARLDRTFAQDREIVELLAQEDSQWLKQEKTEAVLKVSAPAALYFRRRPLIAQQRTVKELEDGGLIVSGKFAHPNQILPIVRYWIPHMRIVSPEGWQKDLEAELQGYLEG